MGSPAASRNPPRVVAISRGFLIAKHEITWQQFLRLVTVSELDRMTQEHVSTLHRFPDGRNFPASVSWPDAKKFCDRLAATLGVTARLVTDAEWEYACRAGTTKAYGERDLIDNTKANIGSWHDQSGKEIFATRPWYVPVGKYPPNRWGIHDMIGNHSEWCLDTYSDNADLGKLPATDPVANRGSGLFRVVRGGSVSVTRDVFEREGAAAHGRGNAIRLVIEVDDRIRAKMQDATKR